MADRPRTPPPAPGLPGTDMTPMIDVVFQLIIVFLCSMKFRTLDMKLEAELARQGRENTVVATEVVPRVHVRLKRAAGVGPTQVLLQDDGIGTTGDGEGVWRTLESRLRGFLARDERCIGDIDAGPEVPHGDVVHCLDAFRGAGMQDVRFRGTRP